MTSGGAEGKTSVRQARYRLACALLDVRSGPDEAGAQLQRALTEPGKDPEDWLLRVSLGNALALAGEWDAALQQLVTALLDAPLEHAEGPASEALALLHRDGLGQVAAVLDESDIRRLLDRAGEEGAPSAVVQLAAELALARGDTKQAETLLDAHRDDSVVRTGPFRSVDLRKRAIRLLDNGDAPGAIQLLSSDPQLRADPSIVAVHALALYASGDKDAGWARLDGQTLTYDVAVARALLLLGWAAEAGVGDRRREFADQALDAATAAVRLEPTRPEAGLLRAQALLEGALDLDEGRRLLTRATRRLGPDLSVVWWSRLQDHVRRDGVHGYFRVEVVAAAERFQDVLALAPGVNTTDTEYVQDAALWELQGVAGRHQGDDQLAASSFTKASETFRASSHRPRAIQARRAAAELAPDVQASLDIAVMLWESSFPAAQGGDNSPGAIEEGLAELDRIEPEVTGPDAVQACYLRGLLLARRAATESGQSAQPSWQAVRFLLAAALADPTDSYKAAHLSWALAEVKLRRAAQHFADQALQLGSRTDQWLMETAIVMRLNWRGSLDANTAELLTRIEIESWRDTVLAVTEFISGNDEALRGLVDRITYGAAWARLVRAQAVARVFGYREAFPLFAALLTETLESGDLDTAIDVALVLGNVDSAREQAQRARENSLIDAYTLDLQATVLRVLEGSPMGTERAVAVLERSIRPAALLWYAHIDLPTLELAHADRPGITQALQKMRHAAAHTIPSVPASPPLDVEIEAGHVRCPDRQLETQIRAMLAAAIPADAEAVVNRPPLVNLELPPTGGQDALQRAMSLVSERVSGGPNSEPHHS